MTDSIAVIGAGNGGLAVAAAAASAGWRVRIGDSDPLVIEQLTAAPALVCDGIIKHTYRPDEVSADLAQIAGGADLVALVVPAIEQGAAAAAVAHALSDQQIVLALPGCTGGALAVAVALRARGCSSFVAEADAFPYACAKTGPAASTISAIKAQFRIAALPASNTDIVLDRLHSLFPQATAAKSVLDTSLTNMNAVLHVPTMLANIGRIEAARPFDFYRDGVTPGVARLIDAYDSERLRLADALGAEVPTLHEWVRAAYGVTAATTYKLIQTLHRDVYGVVPAPRSLAHRFLSEDLACGTVPVADLSRQLALAAPTHTALVALGEIVCQADFLRSGRTTGQLGLVGLDAEEIRLLAKGSYW